MAWWLPAGSWPTASTLASHATCHWLHALLASHAACFTCHWLHTSQASHATGFACVEQVDIMESEPNQTVRVKGALCAVHATLCMPRWHSGAGVARSACACARARWLCLCRGASAGLHSGHEHAAALRRAGQALPWLSTARNHDRFNSWRCHNHDAMCVPCRCRRHQVLRLSEDCAVHAGVCWRNSCWRCSWLAWTNDHPRRPLGSHESCPVAHERIRLAAPNPCIQRSSLRGAHVQEGDEVLLYQMVKPNSKEQPGLTALCCVASAPYPDPSECPNPCRVLVQVLMVAAMFAARPSIAVGLTALRCVASARYPHRTRPCCLSPVHSVWNPMAGPAVTADQWRRCRGGCACRAQHARMHPPAAADGKWLAFDLRLEEPFDSERGGSVAASSSCCRWAVTDEGAELCTPCHAAMQRLPCLYPCRIFECHALPCHAMPCHAMPCPFACHEATPCHATLLHRRMPLNNMKT